MNVRAKICGLRDAASVQAAADGGAIFAGFVFHPSSPRAVDPQHAAALIALLPPPTAAVGLFVDPTDDDLRRTLAAAPLRLIQLHGNETHERTADIRRQTGLPVIKAVGIAATADRERARSYETVADYLLLDAKPAPGARAGGNGVAFDWSLLSGVNFTKPWLLAGGLDASNAAAAVAATHARILDASSGVEEALGVKSTAKIRDFLQTVRKLETCC